MAVVGMGIAVPGASDPEEFWKLVCGGSPVFDEPRQRYALENFWSADADAQDRSYSRVSGFLHNFRPHPRLAREIAAGTFDTGEQNPVWLRHCLLQAGDTCTARGTDRYAYYVGSSTLAGQRTDEAALIESVALHTAEHRPGVGPAGQNGTDRERLRGLLQRHYGHGGATPMDTLPHRVARTAATGLLPDDCEFAVVDAACSSSLYTIALGARSLLAGDCDIAYCGGVSGVSPRYNITFAKLRGLTRSGDVRVFDRDADGTLFSDGAAVVALKRLDRALADADPVLGVLLGFGGSADGRGTAIYAPNPNGQRRCLDLAWRDAGVTADDIDWVVAHGTGTTVGDAVELRTLADASRPVTLRCSSHKSLFGHSAWSSGAVSVIELLMALRQEKIPAQHRFAEPAPAAESGRGVCVPVVETPWPRDDRRSRIGGVSAFGFGGTNAHLLIGDRAPAGSARSAVIGDSDPVVLLAWTAHLPGDPDTEELARFVRGGPVPGPRTFGASYPAPPFEDMRLPPPTVRATDPAQLMALRTMALFIAEHGELWSSMRASTGVVAATSGPPVSGADNLVRCYAAEVADLLDGADRTAFDEFLNELRSTTPPTTKDTLPGLLPNIIAARIANRHDLGGGTMLTDTGSTSGLTAVHTAVRLLAWQELDMALVLGVSPTSRPDFASLIGVDPERVAEGAFLMALSRESVALAHGLDPLARLTSTWSTTPHPPHTSPIGSGLQGMTFLGADGVLAVLRAVYAGGDHAVVGPKSDEAGPVITLSPTAKGHPTTRNSR
ncbi:beta-ketoacyl synthase N-terminal-like domain-containing protein [Solwaraspora sp. WMMD1047]|uniref:beta-ketoacyl synthase N-terminal-like domain-containing protein n=1 Tax=Solwaraspora sp. WMMD1047 TaxID=3016102 RepID=UPI002416C95F|nr:beta-ketoacyl synthase N-terminal-like domain-containing protein [Solwaraspora sp. WMMD1047]MDG4830639.1 beta-ketoacyl synthase N-terminal-like domain-containing protein [Solwaraspora sp. WMMD1047]